MENKKNNKNESLTDASISFSKFLNKRKQKNEIEFSKNSVKSVSNYVISKDFENDEKTLQVEISVPSKIRENVKKTENFELLKDIENKKASIEELKNRILSKRNNETDVSDKVTQRKIVEENQKNIKDLFNKFDIEIDSKTIVEQKKPRELVEYESTYSNLNNITQKTNSINTQNQFRNTYSNFKMNETNETPLIKDYAKEIFEQNEIDSIIDETLREVTVENYVSPIRERTIEQNITNYNSYTKSNNKKIRKEYELPSESLLDDFDENSYDIFEQKAEIRENVEKLNFLFKSFNLNAKVVSYQTGPTITVYEVHLEPGQKISKLKSLEDNIKISLSVKDIRLQTPIPGKTLIGIDVPNRNRRVVTFKNVYNESKYGVEPFEKKHDISISIGQDLFGKPITFDLAKAPHLLVAGSTGSGKSVAINSILISLLMNYNPTELKMLLIDPKMVEFTPYHNIPHLITPILTEVEKAKRALQVVVEEMEKRYRLLSSNMVRNIKEHNQRNPKKKLPYLVVIIDELSDLMMAANSKKTSKKENIVEESIVRITQKARAAGIHMIIATQRPSVDVITGLIKANIPSRIAFTVSSQVDSRTIIDAVGAEKLVGEGDMLISLYGQQPSRGQGCYISSNEIEKVTDFVRSQNKNNKSEFEFKMDEATSESVIPERVIINQNNNVKEETFEFDNELVILSFDILCKNNIINIEILKEKLSINSSDAIKIINTLKQIDAIKQIDNLNFVPKGDVCEL